MCLVTWIYDQADCEGRSIAVQSGKYHNLVDYAITARYSRVSNGTNAKQKLVEKDRTTASLSMIL